MLTKSFYKSACIPGALAASLMLTNVPQSDAQEQQPQAMPPQPQMMIVTPDGNRARIVVTPDGQVVLVPMISPQVSEFRENVMLLGAAARAVGTQAYVELGQEEIFRRILKGFPEKALKDAGIDLNDSTEYVTTPESLSRTLISLYKQIEVKDFDKVTEDAVASLFSSLDAHSSYIKPQDSARFRAQSRGEFGGLGITVKLDEKTGLVQIIETLKDEPAFRAGLLADDLISSIDGKPVKGMTLQDATDLMRGKPGEEIILGIQRSGVELTPMTLAREIIEVSPVDYENMDGIGYIKLKSFTAKSEEDMIEAIQDLEKQGVESYVLDLRFNPGGLLKQAAAVADIFLANGQKIVSQQDRSGENDIMTADKIDMINGKELKVLINGASASASEIVSGVLQHYGRAEIVGTRSFGKGSVQTIMPAPKGAFRLTTALYNIAGEVPIQGYGVIPDVKVTFGDATEIEINRKETSLEGVLANPNAPKEHDVAKVCKPINDNPRLFDRLSGDFKLGGKPDGIVDASLLCATEALKDIEGFTTRHDFVAPAQAQKQPQLIPQL